MGGNRCVQAVEFRLESVDVEGEVGNSQAGNHSTSLLHLLSCVLVQVKYSIHFDIP